MSPPASDAKTTPPAIVWFRYDLRLQDHPALLAAVKTGQPLLLVYILDDETPKLRRLGGASRWWLDASLRALSAQIERSGAALQVFAGTADHVLASLAAESGASSVFWNRLYSSAEMEADRRIEERLKEAGIEVQTFNGNLGHEPDEIQPQTGGWYKVYSAYWKATQAGRPWGEPAPAPKTLHGSGFKPKHCEALMIDDLDLLPKQPDWSGGLREAWTPGEAEAHRKLKLFAETKIGDYGTARDRPAVEGSSRLSPHLRFGEITPRQIMAAVKGLRASTKFQQEITWRDFCYNILSHVPDLATESYDPKFRDFAPDAMSPSGLKAWKTGRTGYPIVDAGMRQLWQTGWMHNRVRMITASFLIKDLLEDWRKGEQWFWNTLCDADPADNTVNWQWVAGTGPDAAPFFRIFNPVLQGEKFDAEGIYVKAFVPELANLPARWVHKPWEAPAGVLEQAGVTLGTTYPRPIVEHGEARERALDAYKTTRRGIGDDRPATEG